MKEYHIHLLFFCNDRLKKQSNFFSVVYINREKHIRDKMSLKQ